MQTGILEDYIKIQPKGVITIPKKLRTYAGIEENTVARVKADRGRLTIEVTRMLPYPVRTYSKEEIQEFIDSDLKESK